MKKLLTLLLLSVSFTSMAECPWSTVIDTHKWYKRYQVPAARMIHLRQIVDGRFLIFDKYNIVVDVKGLKLNGQLRKGQTLRQTTRFIGSLKGEAGKITFTRRDGFPVEMKLYHPLFDLKKDVFDKCSTSELKNGIMLDRRI